MVKRRERIPRILPAGSVRKATLGLSGDVDSRLSYWARRRGVTRSELANSILEGALPRVTAAEPAGRAESAA